MNQTASPTKIHLLAKDLGCVRGGRLVYSEVSFEVSSGEALLLRGPNGSGKSTLLMSLAGLLPYEGQLFWNLDNDTLDGTSLVQLFHFVGHLSAMKPELTLLENLRFWAALFGGDEKNIEPALEEAGLGGLDNYHAGHLSAGQKHRLSLARLLISPRPVWLLDEPSSALDAKGDIWVAGLITKHLETGGIVIAATHRPIELETGATVHTLILGGN